MNSLSSPAVANAIRNLGFETLNEMQQQMLTVCKNNSQVLLFSPTGSGKTAAFLLPLLAHPSIHSGSIAALIVVPSRELALQIEQVFKSMATGLKVTTVYGGHPVRTERNNLKEIPFLLIGTPGRILYHFDKGNIDPGTISTLIMDEYDKSLEFGFEREISSIWGHIPNIGQLVLTSATKSSSVPGFMGLQDPIVLDYSSNEQPHGLEIKLVRTTGRDKLSLLMKVLSYIDDGLTLVFCNHRDAVERISELLHRHDIHHDTYHGGYEQPQRERALIKFRNGSTLILITTDLASRGLDITGVDNIIHYQLASSESVFIHRNGRTARMENRGTAWILLGEEDKIPDYVPDDCQEIDLPDQFRKRRPPKFLTLYIGAGKKDKISKTDIVGLLIQKGALNKEDIGLIYVLDYESYVAISAQKSRGVLARLRDQKIKNRKVKIASSN